MKIFRIQHYILKWQVSIRSIDSQNERFKTTAMQGVIVCRNLPLDGILTTKLGDYPSKGLTVEQPTDIPRSSLNLCLNV